MSALMRLLRSRKLAVWLIVFLTVYAFIATLVPRGPDDSAEVAQWASAHPIAEIAARAFGLHHAFSSVFFLLPVTLLMVSTFACAWERTALAYEGFLGAGQVSRGFVDRLKDRPDMIVPPASGRDPLEAVEGLLRRQGMKTRRGQVLVEARMNRAGLIGSPVFHWALVLLFAVIAMGQLTRAEGGISLMADQVKPDLREAYASGLIEGPLFGDRFTGVEISISDMNAEFEVDGVFRGEATRVVLSREGVPFVEQWVYTNNPIVVDSLTIHHKQLGPAALGTLTNPSDESTQPVELFFTLDPAAEFGIAPLIIPGVDIEGFEAIRIEPIEGQRLSLSELDTTGQAATSYTMAVGDSVELVTGEVLTLDALSAYSQLTLVNDWSVPYIYVLLAVLSVAVVPSIFFPPRTAWALSVSDSGEPGIHLRLRTRRSDAMWSRRVRDALSELAEPSCEDGLQAESED